MMSYAVDLLLAHRAMPVTLLETALPFAASSVRLVNTALRVQKFVKIAHLAVLYVRYICPYFQNHLPNIFPRLFKAPTNASTTCIKCGLGTVQPLGGSFSCIDCTPGYFMRVSGATVCRDCPIGTSQVQQPTSPFTFCF